MSNLKFENLPEWIEKGWVGFQKMEPPTGKIFKIKIPQSVLDINVDNKR